MASSLNIQEVQLNNTFDEFRLRTNTVIAELNKFGTGSATVTVGSLETSTGLGEDGHLTVNGDLLVTGNATIEGNLTFGNAETDTISFVADIASNVLPDTPYNFSLGSATKQWQDLYLSGTAAINIVTAQSATVVNDFTVDTNTFHVDSTTNRIGILDTSPEVTLDIGSATDAIHIPVGTTAERPGSPESGFFRYNTSLSQFEGYTTTWGAIGGGGTNTFTTDIFTGDNSTTDFVLSQATEFDTSLMVFIDGVYQTPNAYDISTTLGITTLSFSAAPANGRTIVAYVVAAGVSGNNLNQNLFTGDGATVTYTLSIAPVNKNNTQVFIDGVYQQKDAYSVSGYDVTFTDPPPDQTTIEVMTFTQTEVNVPVDGTIKSIHLSGDLVTPGALDVTTDLTVTGTTTLNGNLVIGDANTDTITISSEISSSLIPSQDITYDLGASGNAWRDLYLAGSTIYIGGGKLEYNDTSNQFELKNAADAVVPVSLSANSTTDLSEGTRLYYTTGRVLSDGTSIVPGGSLAGTVGDAALQYRADGNYSGTPQQGSFYFDGLNSRLKVYTGASFIDAVPVSGGGGGATTDANATFSKYLYTIASQTNVVTGASDEVVGYTQLYIGKDYEIVSESSTDFIAFGATTGTVGETFTVDSDGTSNIADLVLAKEYEIVTAGDTDFTVIGAVDNNVGTVFTFNGVTSQSATTGTVIAEGNGTANPVLVYVVDDATSVEVYVNGIKQYEGATNDYVATTGSSVNFTYNLPADALVDVQVYELLTNDAYYIKTETYSQAQVNTQISNALTIYDDQTASDARYVNIDGDTMTGNLDVTGSVTADGLTVDGNPVINGTSPQLFLQTSASNTNWQIAAQENVSNAFEISSGAADASAPDDTYTPRLVILNTGNVGIGISPAHKLSIFGTGAGNATVQIEGEGGADPYINFLTNNTQHWSLGVDDSDADKFKLSEHSALGTNDYFVVDVTGNVGIGTGSPDWGIQTGNFRGSASAPVFSGTSGDGFAFDYYNGPNPYPRHGSIAVIGAGTATADMSFWTDSGSAVVERMRIDASGNVGIGTDNPSENLHIYSSSAAADVKLEAAAAGQDSRLFIVRNGSTSRAYISFQDTVNNAGNWYTGLLRNTNDVFTIGRGDDFGTASYLNIDTAGNVGIGCTPDTALNAFGYTVLEVAGATTTKSGAILLSNSSGTDFGQIYADNADGWKFVNGQTTKSTIFYGGSGTSEQMRIDANGGVIIGAFTGTKPTWFGNSDLILNDNTFAFQGKNYDDAVFNTSVDATVTYLTHNGYWNSGWQQHKDGVPVSQLVIGNGSLQFRNAPDAGGTDVPATGLEAKFTVDASGNLLVDTADPSVSVGEGIKLRGSADDKGVALVSANSTSASEGFTMWSTGANAWRFYVGWDGKINATSNTIQAISDQRFKENIRDLDDGLSKVMQLKPRKFDWKEGKGSDIKDARGFIAQEFEEVFPDLIGEWKDPAPEGEEPYKSVSQDLIPTLVKAIQEQQEQIEQLKADIAVLKGAN